MITIIKMLIYLMICNISITIKKDWMYNILLKCRKILLSEPEYPVNNKIKYSKSPIQNKINQAYAQSEICEEL